MYNYLTNLSFDFYKEYVYSLFLLNVFIYLVLLFSIFSVFFLVDIRRIKTLNELKFVGSIQSFSIFIIIFLMSFAGIPPLLGFGGKFLIFIVLFTTSTWLFVVLFTFLNIFLMYFYIQNFRFVTSKKINEKIFFKYNFEKCNLTVNFVNFFSFCSFFGILYFEEFLVFVNLVGSTLFI